LAATWPVSGQGNTPMDPLAIYEDLKQKIIWLDLSPGCTLNLAELAGRYGVSRNPVMIALARLDAEQWVVRHGVHFVVSPLTVDRMREITEIRSLLEPQATIWAMNRMTAEGLEELRKIREEILSINIQASKKQIVEIDFRFHQLIFRQTRNHHLSELLERLLCHYLRFWLAGPQTIEPTAFFSQALEVIRAIESRDTVRLQAASSAHIKVSLDKILGL
jgi:DNA-binding GntR family transcriptional regulator